MATLHRTYRFRMQPTRQQEAQMRRIAGARRWVWNWALARRMEHYAATGKGLSFADLSKELTEIKRRPETAWLNEAIAQSLQQAIRDLDRAFRLFFEKKTAFPTFKAKKRDRARFHIPQRTKVRAGRVYVPKVGWIRIHQSRQIEGEIKSATFKQDNCGFWYVTIPVSFSAPDPPEVQPAADKTVGIDAGLESFAVLSTGEPPIENPRFYRKAARKLARLHRTQDRRKQGSKRRERARRALARCYQKVRHRRLDFLHQHSIRIVRRFDGICIEDLSLQALARAKRGLGKSFLDAAWGEFRRQLTYKALWHGKRLVAIDRFYPSSRECSVCHRVNGEITIRDRHWTCTCGTLHDRDLNAALNIREAGLRLLAGRHPDSSTHGEPV